LRQKDDPLRLGVLLSGGGTTLENFFKEIDEGRLPAVVAVVVSSQPRAYGLKRARRRLVPAFVSRLKDFPSEESFSDSITERLRAHGADLVLMAGFLQRYVIPPCFEGRVMNIHPALIPQYCGKGFYGHRVHEAVVAAGERESGCTVHFADNEYDHGPIILQRRVRIEEGDTPDEVAAKVFKEECIAYPEAVRRFIEGEVG
jgi:phosphoribosylglycinamide formyltransferase-1